MSYHPRRQAQRSVEDERPPLAQGIREDFSRRWHLAVFRRMGRMWGDDCRIFMKDIQRLEVESKASDSSE